MATRPLILELDEADWETVQSFVADYQAKNHHRDGGTIVPEGESNLVGAIVAEAVRNMLEYRQMFAAREGAD